MPFMSNEAQALTHGSGREKARPADAVGLGRLSLLVFIAGIGSMATEISASRLLAPYYGSSTIVWANVIGLILASLALGYWLGGRWADRRPSARLLGFIVLAAAVLVAAVPFVARPFLDLSIKGVDTLSPSAVVGSFIAALALFAPPVVLLGMVTPFAIRLSVADIEAAGRAAGRIFALSTAGSLIGTFVPALVTIPLVGTQRTLLGAAALIALAATLVLGWRWLVVGLVLAAALLIPPGVVKAQSGLVYEGESRYQFIQVVQHEEPSGAVRYLYLNEGYAIHSEWRADTVLTGGEWDMFLIAPGLLGRPAQRVVMLGNAGGTTGRAFGAFFPAVRYHGVEIDPQVTAVARRFFGLGDNPNLVVHTADARPFLATSGARYDAIFIDAYRQPYVPFYLATREFFELARRHLAPDGIVALNISTTPTDHVLAKDIAGTLASVFPQVEYWQALRFNALVVGFANPVPAAEQAGRLRGLPARLQVLGDLYARQARPVAVLQNPWTDDRAPVEWVTDAMIVQYAAQGRNLDERLLPTAPR